MNEALPEYTCCVELGSSYLEPSPGHSEWGSMKILSHRNDDATILLHIEQTMPRNGQELALG